MADLTAILEQLRAGDPRAAGALFSFVYEELRRIATRQVHAEASRAHGKRTSTRIIS